MSSWSAVTSPTPAPPGSWSPPQPLPACRCAVCCTPRQSSKTPRWPISPMISSNEIGLQRFTVRGTCTPRWKHSPPTSSWIGSARSPPLLRWWVRPARAPTPRPTVGWTRSPGGAARRAARRPRSPGVPGAKSGVPQSSRRIPARQLVRTRVRSRSKCCCATTAPTPGTRRSSERHG